MFLELTVLALVPDAVAIVQDLILKFQNSHKIAASAQAWRSVAILEKMTQPAAHNVSMQHENQRQEIYDYRPKSLHGRFEMA